MLLLIRGVFMKIMSFNTQHCKNYITGEIDFNIMADAIKCVGADIVGLNEMRGKGNSPEFLAQTKILARLSGLRKFYFAPALKFKSGPYGNGFISRYPIISAKNIPVPDPKERKYSGYYETRCLLKVKLLNGVTVLVIHFGLNPDEQENAVKTVLKHIKKEKCILMGDFNVKPDDELLNPIREKMVDTADFFDGEKFSFPSDVPERKIDYIFVSPDIKVVSADIPPIIASDHRPHIAEIEV